MKRAAKAKERHPSCALWTIVDISVLKMPWQSAPPLIIITGAFALTGYLLNLSDRLYYGRVRIFLFKQLLLDDNVS